MKKNTATATALYINMVSNFIASTEYDSDRKTWWVIVSNKNGEFFGYSRLTDMKKAGYALPSGQEMLEMKLALERNGIRNF